MGVILSTMSNAFETGANVVQDIRNQIIDVNDRKPGYSAVQAKLDARGKCITFYNFSFFDTI